MTDAAETPVVWLAEPGARRTEASRSLAEWARARGVVLVAPVAGRLAPPPDEDASVGERVERELARAQEAAGAADTDAAERALARAEAILRERPDALAAAWLRAEVLRAWSSRWLRLEPRDEARAHAAWQEAAALDGGRVPGIGEESAPAPPRFHVVFDAGPRATLRVDGAPAAREVELAAGEHAVVARVDGAITYAGWIAVAGPTTITLPAAASSACDREAFARVRRDGDRVLAPAVECPAWVAAVPGEASGSVLVARCELAACGPLLEWRTEHASVLAVPQPRDRSKSAWPAWATWTLVGVGAATAASVALVASGVFESRPVEQRFVVGGARQE